MPNGVPSDPAKFRRKTANSTIENSLELIQAYKHDLILLKCLPVVYSNHGLAALRLDLLAKARIKAKLAAPTMRFVRQAPSESDALRQASEAAKTP